MQDITRNELDRFLGHAARLHLEVLGCVDHAGFDPRLATREDQWIWWSRFADEAFDEAGVLRRPMLVHWRGPRADLQLAAARAGLFPWFELVEELAYEGRLVLAPESRGETDLALLLRAFERLGARGAIALPCAGFTQSDGWSDVAGAQEDPEQTAIFWQAQSHEAFDGQGGLTRTLMLYWRGDTELLAEELRREGLGVQVPESDRVAFKVTTAGAAPAHPTVEDALAFEGELPPPPSVVDLQPGLVELARTAHLLGHPVGRLQWDGDTLWAAQAFSEAGFPEAPLIALDAATLAPGRVLQGVHRNPSCGGLARLPDGRFLAGWYAFSGDGGVVSVCEVDGDAEVEVVSSSPSHVSAIRLLDVDRAGRWLVLPTARGAEIRGIGPKGTKASLSTRPQVGRVRRRRAGPAPADPWPVAREITVAGDQRTYGAVAMTPDGAWVARLSGGTPWLGGWAREGHTSWEVRGEVNVWDLHAADAGTFALVGRRYDSEAQQDHGFLRLHEATTGHVVEAELSAAVGDVRAVTFSPDGRHLVAGHFDGTVSVWTRAGERLGGGRIGHGAVTAVAATEDGRIAAGTDRGEVVLLAHQPRWGAQA